MKKTDTLHQENQKILQEHSGLQQLVKAKMKKIKLRRVIAILSCFVLLLTLNQLKFEADTLQRLPSCNLESHVHTESCYQDGELICGLPEHEHTDACYQQRPVNPEPTVFDEFMDLNSQVVLASPSDEDAEISVEDVDEDVSETTIELGDDGYSVVNDDSYSGLEVEMDLDDLYDEEQADDGNEEPSIDSNSVIDGDSLLDSNSLIDNEPSKENEAVYTMPGDSVTFLSDVLNSVGMSLSSITSVGEIVEEEAAEAHLSIEAVEGVDGEYALRVVKDFDRITLGVITDSDIIEIVLKDGVAAGTDAEGAEELEAVSDLEGEEYRDDTGLDDEFQETVEPVIENEEFSNIPETTEIDPKQTEVGNSDLTEEAASALVAGDPTLVGATSMEVEDEASEDEVSENEQSEDAEVDDANGDASADEEMTGDSSAIEDAQGEEATDDSSVKDEDEKDEDAQSGDSQSEDAAGDISVKDEETAETEEKQETEKQDADEGEQTDEEKSDEEQTEEDQTDDEARDPSDEEVEDAADGQTEDEQQVGDGSEVEDEQQGDGEQSEDEQQGDGEQSEDEQQGDGEQSEDEQQANVEQNEAEQTVIRHHVSLDFSAYIVADSHTVYLYDDAMNAVLVNTAEIDSVDGVVVTTTAEEVPAEKAEVAEAEEAPVAEEEQTSEVDTEAVEEQPERKSGVLVITGDGEYTLDDTIYTATGLVLPGTEEPSNEEEAPTEVEPSDEEEGVEEEAGDEESSAADQTPVMEQVIVGYKLEYDLAEVEAYPLSLRGLMAQAEPVYEEVIIESDVSADDNDSADEEEMVDGEEVDPTTDAEAADENSSAVTATDAEVKETTGDATSTAEEAVLEETVDSDAEVAGNNSETVEYDDALIAVEQIDEDWLITPAADFEATEIVIGLYEITLLNGKVPITYPAVVFDDSTEYINVHVEAPEGAFPEGTTMHLEDVVDEQALAEIGDAAVTEENVEVQRVHAVDITFRNKAEQEIEPRTAISVVMTLREIEKDEETVVVHMDDEGNINTVAADAAPANAVLPAEDVDQTATDVAEIGEETVQSVEDTPAGSVSFTTDAFSIYAMVVTKKIETRYIAASGETYNITITYGPEAMIPDEATLSVSEVTGVEVEDYLEKTEEALDTAKRVTSARFFDIKIMVGEEEIQPVAPVKVQMVLEGEQAEDATPYAVHFENNGGEESEVPVLVEATENEDAIEFSADSFSVWGVVYTVDFHFEVNGREYTYTMPGGGFARLSEILGALCVGMTDDDVEPLPKATDLPLRAEDEASESVDTPTETGGATTENASALLVDVASVSFSNPDLLWVGRVGSATTVGAIRYANGLEPQYTAELGESAAEKFDAQTIEAGDWALISLLPFESAETLTVTLANGDSFTIKVTDAQVNIISPNSLKGKKFALISHDYYGNPGALLLPEWKANGYIKGQWVDVNALDGSTPQWQFIDAGNNKFYITAPNGEYLHVWIGNGQHHVWLSSERQALNVGLYQGDYIRITNDSGAAVNLWGWDANQGFTAYDGYNQYNAEWNEKFRVYDLTGQHIDNSGHYAIYTEKNGYYYVLKNDLSTVRIDASQDALKTLSRDYLWQFEDSDTANYSYVARTIKDGQVYQLQFNNGWRLVPEEEHAYNDDTLHIWVGDSGNTSIWGPDTTERLFLNSSDSFEDNLQGQKTFVRLYNVDRRFFTVESADYSMGGVTGFDMDQTNQNDVSGFVTCTNLGNNGVYTNNWQINAIPNTGFAFDHWELDGVALDANAYPVTIQAGGLSITADGSLLRAVFRKIASGSSNPYPPRPVPDDPLWIADALTADPISVADKTAEVYDYENRIYRIDLTGHSGFKAINSDLAIAFVTDVSNSMLFPDSLDEVRQNGNVVTLWYKENYSSNLGEQIRSKGLDTGKVYITIGDRNVTSTQYAVFYANGWYRDHQFDEGWYALDASYYARWMAGVYGYGDSKMYSGGSHRIKKLDETYSLHNSDSGPNYSGGYTYTIYEPSEYWEHSFRSADALYARNDDSKFSNRLYYLSESVRQALDQIYKMANYYPLGSIYAALETFAGATQQLTSDNLETLLEKTLGAPSTYGTRHQNFVQIGGATAYNGDNFANNEADIMNKLKNLTTYDGTAQDLAIQYMNRVIDWESIPKSTNLKKYVIMITDGAPNRSGLTPGAVADIINGEKINGNLKDTTLITVGLGIDDVPGGQQLLYTIADSDAGGRLYYNARDGYDLMNILMEIIHDIMEEAAVVGNVVDTIDPAFYPVNKDTGLPLALNNGKAYIALDGAVLNSAPTDGTPYGEVTYDQTTDTWKVTWTDQEFKPEKNGGWHGTVYVKAKEEFMGGNTITTNVGQATITPSAYYRIDDDGDRAPDAQNITIPEPTQTYPNNRRLPVSLDTPYVNVDELSFTRNDTEWTVYLDTTVSPREQLKALYGKIMVNEVVDHTLNGAHRLNDGNTTYTLREGTADNTTPVNGQEQFPLTSIPNMGVDALDWDTLFTTGKIENILYNAYGHDAGSFTVELIPVYGEGENGLVDETGNGHTANIVGDEVEKYTVKVTYNPYAYDPTRNYHTGAYGTKKAGKLTDDIISDNDHIINVYAKPIEVYKVDRDDPTIRVEGAKFGLYRAAKQSEIDAGNAVSLAQYNAELTGQYFLVDEVSSSAEGVVQLAVPTDGMDDQKLLVPGIEYVLIETQAPAGYQRDDSIKRIIVTAGPNRYTTLDKQTIEEANLADNRPYDWEQGVKIFVDGVLARIVDPTTRMDEAGRDFIWKNDTVVFQADYTNQRTQELVLRKVGVSNSDPDKIQYELGGAKFTIYQATGTNYDTKGDIVTLQGVPLENLTSDATTGIFWQGDMPIGHYLLEEVETPPGYNSLTGMVHLLVNRDGVTASYTVAVGDITNITTVTEEPKNVFTISIANTAGYELPSTGGPGTMVFYILGSIITLLAAVLLITKRRSYDGE